MKGSALDILAEPFTGWPSIFLARSARLGSGRFATRRASTGSAVRYRGPPVRSNNGTRILIGSRITDYATAMMAVSAILPRIMPVPQERICGRIPMSVADVHPRAGSSHRRLRLKIGHFRLGTQVFEQLRPAGRPRET